MNEGTTGLRSSGDASDIHSFPNICDDGIVESPVFFGMFSAVCLYADELDWL